MPLRTKKQEKKKDEVRRDPILKQNQGRLHPSHQQPAPASRVLLPSKEGGTSRWCRRGVARFYSHNESVWICWSAAARGGLAVRSRMMMSQQLCVGASILYEMPSGLMLLLKLLLQ
jgi:hypothetical protein